MWPPVQTHKNPYFAYVAASQGPAGLVDAATLQDIGNQVAGFVAPPKTRGLVDNSAAQGAYFMERLRAMDIPAARDIRGRGLLIGLELDCKARPYCEALMERGLLCKETHDNVIRFAPPLVITREEVDWALERIESVVSKRL